MCTLALDFYGQCRSRAIASHSACAANVVMREIAPMAPADTTTRPAPEAVRLPPRPRGLLRRLEHAPTAARALVRADEIWLVVLAALVGIAAGLLTVAMNLTTQTMHQLLFGIQAGARLSAQMDIPRSRALVPAIGGVLMGLFALALARWRSRRTIDPIEANALYGGRMSLGDSLIVVAQTLISNGFGASVGLEAGFTQIGSAVGSRLGRAFRLRRGDMRVLVGAGAAGAIAAAFNAPLTGAFYAYELVIGTYSLATLAPVVGAAITAVITARKLLGDEPGFDVPLLPVAELAAFIPILVLGMLAALAGVMLMRGVTLTEATFRRSFVPAWIRPAIGGLALGAAALISPAMLSSGHGALHVVLTADVPLRTLLILLALKSAASAISIGSGFRGGLFFASLLMGALLGKAFAAIMLLIWPVPMFPEVIYGLVGMSAFAVAVVGGPLTMSFLALESTGSFPLTVAVLAASVVSSLTVRRTFGYSFATWRFHLRGEAIRSAVDIGWMRNLTVGRMMRREVRTVPADMTLAMFRRENPLGSTARIIALDEADRYTGIVWLADAYAADATISRVSEILHHRGVVLLPDMTVKEAVDMFERAEADALAVVESDKSMRVIGLLTEQYALRRYAEELDRRRRDLSGE
ncbi:MAG TPA: chloride channel protein [Acetobacteraceae bacterium]|nr:chloride channel protein [Acetobacteraceae bacterium]